jgi:DNA-binding transcriptional LysR family regulator
MPISLRGLDAFRHVLASGSASAAAERLGVSQPSISRLIARLELDLGITLFQRSNGRLIPTAEALILADEVDSTLGRIDRLALLARNINDLDIGELHVAALPSLVAGPLADIIATFMTQHPKIKVNLEPRDGESLIELVAAKVADCAVTRLPIDHPTILVESLVTCGTVCVLPNGHALLSHERLSPTHLRRERLIMLGRGRESRRAIERAFSKDNVVPEVCLETHTVGSACAFAARGIGIAIVNEMMARACATPDVQLRPFIPNIMHEYGFLTSSLKPPSRTTDAFRRACRRHFSGAE